MYLSGDVLDYKIQRSWEFNSSLPLRSIVIPYCTIAPVLTLARILSEHFDFLLDNNLLLVLPRVPMLLLSLLTDRTMYNLSKHHTSSPDKVMSLYTSSYVVLVYFTHTLSNSIEAFLFAFLLYFTTIKKKDISKTFHKLYCSSLLTDRECALPISFILVSGVFNRPTFALFAFMPIMYWLFNKHNKSFVFSNIFNIFLYGLSFSSMFISFDTTYYKNVNIIDHLCNNFNNVIQNGFSSFPDAATNFTVTPLNFFNYNSKQSNLAHHGLHAKYQHFLVNIPMLLGPMAIVLFSKLVIKVTNGYVPKKIGLFLSSAMLPVAFLSWFPHQEPRFIIPIVVPVAILYGLFHMNSKFFNICWILFNLFMCIFYGVLHQGGIVSAIAELRQTIEQSEQPNHVIFYHTYMPPHHLFAHKDSTHLYIEDLKGASILSLKDSVKRARHQCINCTIFIVSPATLHTDLCEHLYQENKGLRFFSKTKLHLSMENPPDLNEKSNVYSDSCEDKINSSRSMYNSLSLYIYRYE